MTQGIFEITENRLIARDIYRLCLRGNTGAMSAQGQFVNIRLEGRFLRRPISVCCYDDDSITLIYKIAGGGTRQLSEMHKGEKLDLLAGLGNGFDTSKSGPSPLLIGGGVGAAPMYGLCRELISQGKSVTVALGFNSVHEAYYPDEFAATGARVFLATVDGSLGIHGFVTDAMVGVEYSYFYACGPMPMLEAVNGAVSTDGQFSLEERMGCGFGVCMGCSCQTLTGSRRICRDGPVLEKGEILWPTHE